MASLLPSVGPEDIPSPAPDGPTAPFVRKTKAEKRALKHAKRKALQKDAQKRAKRRKREALDQAWASMTEAEREATRTARKEAQELARGKLEKGFREGLRVAVDCGFTEQNSDRETRSLSKQIRYGYTVLKQGTGCISLHLVSYHGEIAQQLEQTGCASWLVHRHPETLEDALGDQKLVYLSPDATKELETLDANAVYVVGGIVDRTVAKGVSIDKARALGIEAVRLPMSAVSDELRPNLILNVDHVIHALARYQEEGDWGAALKAVIPQRRAATGRPTRDSNARAAAADGDCADMDGEVSAEASSMDEAEAGAAC